MTVKTRELELKAALSDQLATMDGIASEFKIEGKNVEVSAEQAAAYRGALANAEEIKGLLEMETSRGELKSWAGSPGGSSVAAQAAAGVREAIGGMESKSLGEMFTGSDEFKALLASGATNMPTPWSIETQDLTGYIGGRKDIYTASGPV